MSDKTFILILVVFIFVGVLLYQRALTEEGGYSPLHKFLDMGGFLKVEEDATEKRIVRNTQYQYEMGENLARLSLRLADLEEQKNTLLQNRNANLEKLIAFNQKQRGAAEEFIDILNKERQAFAGRLSEWEELEQQISELQGTADPQERQKRFDTLQERLSELFEEITGQPKEEISQLGFLLDELEKTVVENMEALQMDCVDADQCLMQGIAAIGSRLDDLQQQYVEGPSRDLSDLLELNGSIDYEYKFLKMNEVATEEQLDEAARTMEESYADLVRVLVELTQEDLVRMMSLYKEIGDDQSAYMDNLRLHQERVREKEAEAYRQMDEIVRRLEESPKIDFRSLTKAYKNQQFTRQALADDFQANAKELDNLFARKVEENENFIKGISADLGLGDDQRLAARTNNGPAQHGGSQYADKQNPTHTSKNLLDTYQMNSKEGQLGEISSAAAPQADIIPIDMDLRQNETPVAYYNADEKMQQMRNQNKDNQRRLQEMLGSY